MITAVMSKRLHSQAVKPLSYSCQRGGIAVDQLT